MFQITLKAARELSGYTLDEVAEYCGIAVNELDEVEKDSNFLTANIMLKIKKLYNNLPLEIIYLGKETNIIKHNRSITFNIGGQ